MDDFHKKITIRLFDTVIHDELLNNCLQHDRDKVKARFSAAMSVINPDRATAMMNKILVSHEWENTEEVNKHFALIKDSFCEIR